MYFLYSHTEVWILKFLPQRWTQNPIATAPSMPGWRLALPLASLRLSDHTWDLLPETAGPAWLWMTEQCSLHLTLIFPTCHRCRSQSTSSSQSERRAVSSRMVRFWTGWEWRCGPATDQPTRHPPAGAPQVKASSVQGHVLSLRSLSWMSSMSEKGSARLKDRRTPVFLVLSPLDNIPKHAEKYSKCPVNTGFITF